MPKKPKKNPIVIPSLPKKRHEPGTQPVVVIDGMNFAYTANYAYSKLKHRTLDTIISVSMLFGIPTMIDSACRLHGWNPAKVIVCWDGFRSELRKKWLPEYKSHRDHSPAEKKALLKRIRKVRVMLKLMGIPQAWDEEIEGDDMIYMVVKKESLNHRVVIISSDKDFVQVINRDVTLYNHRTKEIFVPELVGASNYGVPLHQIVDFYCLVGDKSDDIPGYRGIGPVRAANFLNKFGSIQRYLDDSKAEFSGISDKEELAKIYTRNKKMMDLKWFYEKYKKDKKVKYYKDKQFPKFNLEKYKAFCIKYGLRNFLGELFIKRIKSWNGHE
jgi:5'-3' exonuclease